MRKFKTGKEYPELKGKFKPCKKVTTTIAVQMDEPFEVETLEGTMRGKAGDYLMRGIEGEYYPCNKQIFEETYEFLW